jgi:hypothetical protein
MQALLQIRTLKVPALFVVAMAVAPSLVARPLSAQPLDQSTANAQYTRAIEAIDRKDYDEARRLLLDLWQKGKTYDVAASLGQCEFKLRNFAAAAHYMSFSIANAPPMEDPDVIERFKRGLAEAKAHVGTVHIKANPPPQRLTVDGAPFEVTAWPAEIFLNPGKHAIEAALGASVASRTLEIAAKGDYEIAFELATSKPRDASADTSTTPQPPVAPLPPPPDRSTTRSLTPVWIGSAVAATGLVLGIAELARASNAKDEASALRAETSSAGGGTCLSPDTGDLRTKCANQRDAASRHDNALGWATGGFVIAGAAAAFTVGYLLWPNQPATTGETARRKVSLTPAAGPRLIGLSVAGSFE